MQLINCEVSLTVNWSDKFRPALVGINNPTGATFKITDAEMYVPIVTISTENNNNLLELLKTGFKRTFKWNR